MIDQNFKYDNYNCDIAIKTNQGKYIIEVVGEFWHGLISVEENDKYYTEMIRRRDEHDKKMDYITNTCESKGFTGLLQVTDTEIKKDVEKIVINDMIHNRAIFKGGRTEYYYNYYKWNELEKVLKGFDLTSLYPSMML